MSRRSDLHHPTLRTVLEQLGTLVLRHDGDGPRGDRPVTGVAIDDPHLATPLGPGTVVLGVGAGTDRAVAEVVGRARAAGAAAVAVRHHRTGGAPGRRRPAEDPVVVEVAPDVTWEQLHVFLRTALHPTGLGGDPQTLFERANAIALLADGAVVIEDEQLRVLAYSSLDHEIDDARRATILGRQIPDEYVAQLRDAGITRHLETSGDPVRFDLPGPGLLPRLAVALRSGARTLGLLWVITDDDREARARAVVAEAAPQLAAELERHLTADADRALTRRRAARRLLDGRPVRGLPDLLGNAAPKGFVVLALRPRRPPGDAEAGTALARAERLASVYVDAFRIPALVAPPTGDAVELVIGLDDTTTQGRAREVLDALVERTRATFGLELLGAASSPADDVRDLPEARRDALAVLDLLATGTAPTAAYADVQAGVALRELLALATAGDHLTRGPVVDLAGSSARADAALAETARTYLDRSGDVTATATALGVHRNTVRYRVERFEQLTGTDLADPVHRLVVELQLRLAAPP